MRTSYGQRLHGWATAFGFNRTAAQVLAREEAVAARPALPESRCAWCDHEAGIKPSLDQIVSHGICERHHAKVKADLAALQAEYERTGIGE
jgi:hypothetical protein